MRRVPAGLYAARPADLLGDRRVIGLGAVVHHQADRLDAEAVRLLSPQAGPLGQDGRTLGC